MLQKRMKRRLVRGVDVEAARLEGRLVCDEADHHAVDPAESDDQIARELRLYFEEAAAVDRRSMIAFTS